MYDLDQAAARIYPWCLEHFWLCSMFEPLSKRLALHRGRGPGAGWGYSWFSIRSHPIVLATSDAFP